MKANFNFFTMLFLGALFFTSCEEDNFSKEGEGKVDTSAETMQKVSSYFGSIESLSINNGTNCTNNILMFPSWDVYWQTVDQLDDMIDTYCDAFDATVPSGISDDQYDALADAAGFDEDDKLVQFESDLEFCSLRANIAALEEIWLSQQGDGLWDPTTDPDNHFIDDETERALLSVNAEVLIGDKSNFVYYKFLDDNGNYIEVHNNDQQAMAQVSSGNVPSGNPNVVVVEEQRIDPPSGCKYKVKEVDYHYDDANGKRLKQISKIRREFGNVYGTSVISKSRIKVKTKGYKRKNGEWKNRRTWITAGIDGATVGSDGIGYNACQAIIDPIKKIKEKRRRRVKAKMTIEPFDGTLPDLQYLSVKDNKLYSLHKQGQILIINKDFYDMPID
ncbi:hypothetical protein [Mangrovimonas sp. YM274]|uniref:hypothetical protein n=1 Tax=Mangrovimonas sp. YM274 TaxID=3070660 RepID=UPI0027DB532A|nr:hypothetical protein [Mangrovimonas sp. YM274]WMI68161.1 hypothetical protein RBH95_13530 [Mangrovimonas sp. YM274]